jgi:membrane-associated phospholipid phosphatase
MAKLFHEIVPSAPKSLITILAYNPLLLLVIFVVKHWYNRPRPFDVDHTIDNLPSRLTNNPSFPSGHSIIAASMAKHLSYLYPNKADDLHDLSQQIAQSRVTGGVHYPSDVRGGQQMVQDIWWL